MKRFPNLYEQVCAYDNLVAAAENARKGKGRQGTVKAFYRDFENNIRQLQEELLNHTFRTSVYSIFTVYEPKERIIYRLPFRDRVVHWAIMLIVEPIWVRNFTRDTYSCITGRGIHAAFRKLKKDLKDVEGTQYCLKLDIRKFYPTIDHDILKQVIRKKIKDAALLQLLDGIIDSVPPCEGVPIGNYLSQFFANLYLSEFDHLLKEQYKVKYYYRYADDIVILDSSKERLHGLLIAISNYVQSERRQQLKSNFQIFPVASRGIDFVGYVFYHTHIRTRKRNKQALARQLAKLRKKDLSEREIMLRIASRVGFIQHCNSINLFNKLNVKNVKSMKKFSEVEKTRGKLEGAKLHIDTILNHPIRLLAFELMDSKHNAEKCLTIQYEIEEAPLSGGEMAWVKHITFTGSKALIKQLDGLGPDDFPVETKIIEQVIGDGRKHFYKFTDP
jgi:retron-type reverse transcriptase